MSTAQIPTLAMNKLNTFIGRFVTELRKTPFNIVYEARP